MVKRNLIISVLILIPVLIVVIIFWGKISNFFERERLENPEGNKSSQQNNLNVYYNPEVPVGIALTPPVNETSISPKDPGVKMRFFDMMVDKNGYQPATFAVNKGDSTRIIMKANDGDYDFSIPSVGIYQLVKRGEAKTIAFKASVSGIFNFECRDFCPVGKIIKGSLIVLP